MPCQKLLNYVKKRPKMSSKIHPGSLQGTLLATPASTISNFFKFVQFWVSPGVPKALKLSPDGSPKSRKIKQRLPPETSSEKATRHTLFKDTFPSEFTQKLEDPTSRKHCYLLHGGHIRISMVLVRFCELLLSKRMTPRPLLNLFCIHVAPKKHTNAHQEPR